MRTARHLRFALSIALLASAGGATTALASDRGIGVPPPGDEQARVLAIASKRLKDGEDSFARGDFEHARTAFDDSIDAFITCGYDLRSDQVLQAAYRETVEKVNRYQSMAMDADGDASWPLQEYEATAEDFPVTPDAGDVLAAGADLVNAPFMTRISELQRRFKDEFGRSFTLTGRDTSVHSRLYGYGRAADVRVSDLNPVNVQFIVQNARAMNIRVLDFSTPDRVYQHNVRVIALGRPLDTMATGIHLHLNDQPRVAGYREEPAAKTRITSRQ